MEREHPNLVNAMGVENIRFYIGDVNPQIRNVPQSLTSERNAIRHPRLEEKKKGP
jgi:hypothetical protein